MPATGPPLTPRHRTLTAQLAASIDLPGYPAAINITIPLPSTGDPVDWEGYADEAEIYITIACFTELDMKIYGAYVAFNVSEIPFFEKFWFGITPTREDPLTLPDLFVKVPFSTNDATLTIMS
ncbi:MAG: hypothetical protein MUP13_01375 [Thermoanaerobaculales bacterium]|nr:hypothetical protein [Thermoanaerobaculales bacterium]